MPAPKRQAPIEVTLPAYGVYLLESHHAPSFRMAPQAHAFLELFFVHSGSGAFQIAGQEHACQRNDVVVVPPRQAHTIVDNPAHPLTLYAVCVASTVVRHEPAIFERLPVGRVRIGKSLADETRATFRRLLFEQTQQQAFGPTLIVGLTLQMLASLARATAQLTPRVMSGVEPQSAERRAAVERYVAGLAHRFFERSSLDDAAAELGMSRRRFTTLFAEVTGQTWADYLAELRVEYAQTLLRDTPRSIVSIAFECGYEELSSFYRAFKRATGHSPGDWRAAQRA
jgi:AraC family L-rhamnose operon regulatory protein RhaS